MYSYSAVLGKTWRAVTVEAYLEKGNEGNEVMSDLACQGSAHPT